MFLKDGESVLVDDRAEDFVNAVPRLYRDRGLLEGLSTAGLRVMEKHFSVDAAD